MKTAIMQPYFLPYIGYYQLLSAVDVFVIYDNIKYTKKGWINRNRMLRNGEELTFSLPLKKDSDTLDVVERDLSDEFDRSKLLNQIKGVYRAAPQFKDTFPLLERIIRYGETNLFRYIQHSIVEMCAHIGIETEIVVSSTIMIDHGLKSQDKVIALCTALGSDTYINPMGGLELYDRATFAARGIDLQFMRTKTFEYPQFGIGFVPNLSIIDVLMFNPLVAVREFIHSNCELV